MELFDHYHNLALAGLLHDIGKFWQRAQSSPVDKLGPGYEGFNKADYGNNGAHATWSAAYISQYVPRLGTDYSPVLYHHKPEHPDAQRIALADRLASGERLSDDKAHPKYLQSIFSQLGQGTPSHYLPLAPLSIDAISPDRLLPEKQLPDDRAAYEQLWQEFATDSEQLTEIEDTATLLAEVFYLMERYTWSIPAAFYRSTPDISLFDHSRVTAAVAACLAEQDDATVVDLLGSLRGNNHDATTPVAYLLEGDISGVQRFIYTITARGASSGLRGRSFYLQILTTAIAHYVLRWFGLPLTNLIYAGGGHFYILVPPSVWEVRNELQSEIDRIMLTHHQGDLYVALGMAPLTCHDFQLKNFGNVWRAVSQEVNAVKRQRFAGLNSEELLTAIFDPQGVGGDETTECQVCHYDGYDVDVYARDDDDDGVRKCAMCASLEDLGKDLRQADAVALLEIPPANAQVREGWQAVLADLGIAITIQGRRSRTYIDSNSVPERGVLLGLDHYPTRSDRQALAQDLNCPVANGLRLTVNVMPLDSQDRIITFDELQKGDVGINRLGVLRMDVDDLGQLFIDGFGHDADNIATLARVATLSSSLAYYFEGWVGELCRQVNDMVGRGVIYSVYSGGDDVFIVGNWRYMPELARRISSSLRYYACGNSMVHISGGLTLHGGKEPLYQAAEAAEHALDAAKSLSGKNAFTLFGQSYTWDVFRNIFEWEDDLAQYVTTEGGNRAVLRLITELHQQYEDTARHHQTQDGRDQVLWGPYMWRGVYQLKRLSDRSGSAEQNILWLLDDLQGNNFTSIPQLGLAARWADAETRKPNEKERD